MTSYPIIYLDLIDLAEYVSDDIQNCSLYRLKIEYAVIDDLYFLVIEYKK